MIQEEAKKKAQQHSHYIGEVFKNKLNNMTYRVYCVDPVNDVENVSEFMVLIGFSNTVKETIETTIVENIDFFKANYVKV